MLDTVPRAFPSRWFVAAPSGSNSGGSQVGRRCRLTRNAVAGWNGKLTASTKVRRFPDFPAIDVRAGPPACTPFASLPPSRLDLCVWAEVLYGVQVCVREAPAGPGARNGGAANAQPAGRVIIPAGRSGRAIGGRWSPFFGKVQFPMAKTGQGRPHDQDQQTRQSGPQSDSEPRPVLRPRAGGCERAGRLLPGWLTKEGLSSLSEAW